MGKAEKYTAEGYGAAVAIDPDAIVISSRGTQKIIGPDGQEWGPKLAGVTAGLQAATGPLVVCDPAELADYIRRYDIQPGQANPSDEPLSNGLLVGGRMRSNGDVLITPPENLPDYVSWNKLAQNATEEGIRTQNMNIHHIFVEQGANDYGCTDLRAPNMKCENDHADDESWMLWLFSNAGGQKTFDKSSSFPASAFWSARRYTNYLAYYQWVVDGLQDYDVRNSQLPVRPVRRESLSL